MTVRNASSRLLVNAYPLVTTAIDLLTAADVTVEITRFHILNTTSLPLSFDLAVLDPGQAFAAGAALYWRENIDNRGRVISDINSPGSGITLGPSQRLAIRCSVAGRCAVTMFGTTETIAPGTETGTATVG